MSKVKFCLFASTPDMLQLDFVVKVLTGTPEELGRTAVSWGYDGIEFMPDPEHTPDPELFNRMLGSSNFSIMLDTHQLYVAEPSIERGIRAAKGLARHIHLYEPSRLPPGVSTEKETLDWPNIVRVLGEEGFEGSASVVIVPKGDPEPIARKSAVYLRKIFKGNS